MMGGRATATWPVILALRQNPQGGRVTRVKQDKTTDRIPSPLMGEG